MGRLLSVLALASALQSLETAAQPAIDEKLLAAAVTVMPSHVTNAEIRESLRDGL